MQIAFFVTSKRPMWKASCSGVSSAAVCSFVADETDGRLARKYHQTSTLGAVLDMVTDR